MFMLNNNMLLLLVVAISLATIGPQFGIIASPVDYQDETDLTKPLLAKEAAGDGEASTSSIMASDESKEVKQASTQTTTETVKSPTDPPTPAAAAAAMKAPTDYDVQRVATKAAVNVYGWLPADKQPRKLEDIEAAAKNAPKPPPADYDVERVAARAAAAVYGWLPAQEQPALMTDEDDRADYYVSAPFEV